jgi:lariat debranching enzyme
VGFQVVQFAGLRIAGLSGIYKPNDYNRGHNRGHFERPPFHERGSLISAYHARSVDVFRLQQLAPRQVIPYL